MLRKLGFWGVLNESVLRSLGLLSTWSPVGRSVWEVWVVQVEEVRHWEHL